MNQQEYILEQIQYYEASVQYKNLRLYRDYYEANNPELMSRWLERAYKHKTPNWKIPTPYYSTIVDSMAGFMFSDVQYSSPSEAFDTTLNQILKVNNADTKDMISGTYALAYNRAYELIYTEGENNVQIKYTSLDPLTVIPIYDNSIEQKLTAIIWKRKSGDVMLVDYIDGFVWEYYKLEDGKLIELQKPKTLYFGECNVAEYKSELIGDAPPFSVVISFISALDWTITGNSNEMDRIVDALLLLGKRVSEEDLSTMDEWKVLQEISKDEITPQYLTKNLSPEFRKYVSELLINEIHKHCHVIDWYNPAQMGDTSAKALKTRLFDMNMFSNRIEKVYIHGIRKRIHLLSKLLNQTMVSEAENVNITLNRTVPTDYEDMINTLKGCDWLSTETKVILSGQDWETEKERLKGEAVEINLDDLPPELDNLPPGTTEETIEEDEA